MENIPSITPSDIERYHRVRALSRQLSNAMVKTIPRAAMLETARAVGMERDGMLVFDSMDLTSVLMDSCLFDWLEHGKNLVGKYIEAHPATPGTDEHLLLQAYTRARYRILVPTAVLPGAAIYCLDTLFGERLLLMDIALSQSLASGDLILLATRTIPLGRYWMTTGAPLPIGDRRTGEVILRKLKEEKLLEDTSPAGEHKLALAVIRACLVCGAGEHVRYEGPEKELEIPGPRAPVRPRRRIVGRNEPCPCGSRKKYKLCCMGK